MNQEISNWDRSFLSLRKLRYLHKLRASTLSTRIPMSQLWVVSRVFSGIFKLPCRLKLNWQNAGLYKIRKEAWDIQQTISTGEGEKKGNRLWQAANLQYFKCLYHASTYYTCIRICRFIYTMKQEYINLHQ